MRIARTSRDAAPFDDELRPNWKELAVASAGEPQETGVRQVDRETKPSGER